MPNVKVFFDIVGTCFSHDPVEEAVQLRFGPKLAQYNLTAKVFFHFWLVTSERDSVYMLMTHRPSDTMLDRFSSILPRVLYQAGVPPSAIPGFYTQEDVENIIDAYLHHMRARPGLRDMLQTLKDGGVDFYACSDATPERVKGYFRQAGLLEEFLPDERIVSVASELGKDKPEEEVYQEVMKRYKKDGDDVMIFGAAHAWDLAGAKRCGFITAYTLVYEYAECEDMWGKQDIVAPDLAQLGKAIVAKYGRKA